MKRGEMSNIIEFLYKAFGYRIIMPQNNWGLINFLPNGKEISMVFLEKLPSDFSAIERDVLEQSLSKNADIVYICSEKNYNIVNCGKKYCVLNLEKSEIINTNCNEEILIRNIYTALQNTKLTKEKSIKDIFVRNVDKVTLSIIIINMAIFFITAFLSHSMINIKNSVLLDLGAKVNSFIHRGEYYRLLTAAFLHGGLLHVLLNMYALYSIGPFIYKAYGSKKYIIIYLGSAITSSYLSYVASPYMSVGASGAIFGLFGAALIYGLLNKKVMGKEFVSSIIQVILVNIIIGLNISVVDNFGHIGGVLGGMLIAFLMSIGKVNKKQQF